MKENSIEEDIENINKTLDFLIEYAKSNKELTATAIIILKEPIILLFRKHLIDIERLQKENEELKEENEQLKAFVKSIFDENIEEKYISINSIKEVIKKIDEAEKCARDCIKEKVIIADSDSLNFGRKQAHGYNEQLLQDLIKEKR